MIKFVVLIAVLACVCPLAVVGEGATVNFSLSNFKDVYIFNFLCRGSGGGSFFDTIRRNFCGKTPAKPVSKANKETKTKLKRARKVNRKLTKQTRKQVKRAKKLNKKRLRKVKKTSRKAGKKARRARKHQKRKGMKVRRKAAKKVKTARKQKPKAADKKQV